MFKLVSPRLFPVLLGLAAAAVLDKDKNAEVKNYKNVPADADGNFAYAFDTTNGISAQETGNIAGVNGAAQWTSPEGVQVSVSYVADENGYQPQGNVLPVGPAIPEAILRSLEYIRTHPQKDAPVQVPFRG